MLATLSKGCMLFCPHLNYFLMNCIFWNIRGVKGTEKQLDLKAFLNNHKPHLVSILESKLDETSLRTLKRTMGFYPSSFLAPKACICLLWHPDQVDVQVLEYSRQLLRCSVLFKQSNVRLLVTLVYASNSSSKRQSLWDSIKRLSALVGRLGWIVGGNFNKVFFSNEKMGGQPAHSRHLRKFNSCVLHAGIEDLKSIGHTLSWNNRQDNRIMCKLDRVMGNQAYISSHPNSFVEYLPPGISNHSPLKVVSDPPMSSGPRPFKYFEAWEASPSFALTVHEAWQTPIFDVSIYEKACDTKMALTRWNKDIYSPIQHNHSIHKWALEEIQAALQQSPADPFLIASEGEARLNYSNLLHQEEKFARQKSRQLWLAARDSNSKFFYNSIKSRSVRNSICCLRRPNGSLCSEPEEIKGLTVQYY
ncbi:hypothetical protein QJS04_geneDACA018856 [Acorus gramineus]|uniref:Endonuclease/exonuclease/phosphatase domain-containing protein n=1 Tax=Acorus gramineus TaxID=55184 RepID=A0AAV9BYP4_ACOGR|nr:hypothetical protein QJS04_geneDACA018856 [Acorus gramineus]